MKVNFHHILFIEARKNYTRLVLTDRTIMVLGTLKQWERSLPAEGFCQVHRSYIIAIGHVSSFDNKFVYLPGTQVPVGENYRHALPGKVRVISGEVSRSLALIES